MSMMTATLWGQQPKQKKQLPLPPPPLLPFEQAWLVSLPAPPSAGGAIDADRVYVPLQDGQLIALNRKTGAVLWTQDVGSALAPVVRGDLLMVAEGTTLRALTAANGEPRWATEMRREAMAPGPRLAGDLLVVPMTPDEVLGVRVSDGTMLWRHELGGTAGQISLSVGASAVYVSTPDSRVVAIALDDGHTLWEQTLPGVLSEPAAGRDRAASGARLPVPRLRAPGRSSRA
jgi:outer membrane protein assembly factor BamB